MTAHADRARFRCGDVVLHRPSGERWVVAFADYETGHLAWCGWPEGLARIDDCDLVNAVGEEEHSDWCRRVGKDDGMRGSRVRRLYPEAFAAPVSAGEALATAVLFGVGIAAVCVGSLVSPAHAGEMAIAGAAEAADGFPWWSATALALFLIAAAGGLLWRFGLFVGAVVGFGDGRDDDSGEGGHVTPPEDWRDGR